MGARNYREKHFERSLDTPGEQFSIGFQPGPKSPCGLCPKGAAGLSPELEWHEVKGYFGQSVALCEVGEASSPYILSVSAFFPVQGPST
jgi:hypothetical protein